MPLVLDLLRHGEAVRAEGTPDEARSLSAVGLRDLERLAAHLAGRGWQPGRVFTSPLVRAVESARIVLRRAAPDRILEVLEALRPGDEPARVLEALEAEGVLAGHVLLVGHQPLLGLLARHLTGAAAPALPAGTLLRVELPGPPAAGGGALRWRIRPEDSA